MAVRGVVPVADIVPVFTSIVHIPALLGHNGKTITIHELRDLDCDVFGEAEPSARVMICARLMAAVGGLGLEVFRG